MGDADLLRRSAQALDEDVYHALIRRELAAPLAAWLRAEANTTGRCAARHMRITAKAEAFARAILGEDT